MLRFIRPAILTILCLSQLSLIAQQEIKLNINHFLGQQEFQMNMASVNNIGQTFDVTRIQYYLSSIKIIHDGGQETALPDVYILADVADTDSYSLGEAVFTDIESIVFRIGVDSLTNHADPALWPSDHPLALQNPSTHWGWASGYRFVMMEGSGGISSADFPYEIHGLGDQHYRGEIAIAVHPEDMGDHTLISINADYDRALENINVSSGLNNHGFDDEAADIISNMKLFVFSEVEAPVSSSVHSETPILEFHSYPNPVSTDQIRFSYDLSSYTDISLQLLDISGRMIYTMELDSGQRTDQMPAPSSGTYILRLRSGTEILYADQITVH